MTRMTNARIAGFTFLFYIAVAYPSLLFMNRATDGVLLIVALVLWSVALQLGAEEWRRALQWTLAGAAGAVASSQR